MPIETLADDHLVQRCIACKATHTIAHQGLVAGVADTHAGLSDPRVIALPPCTVCKSQEFLIRSSAGEADAVSQGDYAHLHRLLVDRLHDVLTGKKQLVQAVKGAPLSPIRLGTHVDDATLKRWFPGGLTLPAPSAAETAKAPVPTAEPSAPATVPSAPTHTSPAPAPSAAVATPPAYPATAASSAPAAATHAASGPAATTTASATPAAPAASAPAPHAPGATTSAPHTEPAPTMPAAKGSAT
jgi:hypothetical protein